MAQQQVDSARSGALAAERIRQQQFDQEAAALNTQSQDRYQDFQGQQDQRSKTLADMFTQAPAALPPTADPMPASSSNLVVQAEAKERGEARDRTNQIGAALGNLRSFADVLGATSRLQGRDASQVGQIGGFKRGSSNVLGMELEAANAAGSGTRMLGDVLGGLGRIGTMAGLQGPIGAVGAGAPLQLGGAAKAGASAAAAPLTRSTGLFNFYGAA